MEFERDFLLEVDVTWPIDWFEQVLLKTKHILKQEIEQKLPEMAKLKGVEFNHDQPKHLFDDQHKFFAASKDVLLHPLYSTELFFRTFALSLVSGSSKQLTYYKI